MKGIETLKEWVGALTELGLMLLALAIVLARTPRSSAR
jgi:hypothetical protein